MPTAWHIFLSCPSRQEPPRNHPWTHSSQVSRWGGSRRQPCTPPRYALGVDGVGAARPGACGSLVGAERAAQGADGVAAARPGAYCAPFPILAHVGSWWWGCRRRRAQRAARDARCNACFELLPRSRVEGSGKVIMTRVRPPNDRMPLPHVQCESVRRVTGTGAPSPQATPVPPTGSARTATVRAAAVLTGVLVVGQSCLTQ